VSASAVSRAAECTFDVTRKSGSPSSPSKGFELERERKPPAPDFSFFAFVSGAYCLQKGYSSQLHADGKCA
jgi:hypothetical protein